MDDELFTPEQEAYIKKLVRSDRTNPVIENTDQLPLGTLAYGFEVTPIWDYITLASLPSATSFEVKNGRRCLFMLSGSLFASTVNLCGFNVNIDNVFVLTSRIFVNTINSHQATVPMFKSLDLTPGTHSATISAFGTGVTADVNDFLNLLMVELP